MEKKMESKESNEKSQRKKKKKTWEFLNLHPVSKSRFEEIDRIRDA